MKNSYFENVLFFFIGDKWKDLGLMAAVSRLLRPVMII